MDDSFFVCIRECVGYLAHDIDGVVRRETSLVRKSRAERLTVDVPQHGVQFPGRGPGIAQGEYERVTQPCEKLDLAVEPFGSKGDAVLGSQHLYGNWAIVPKVVREIDDGHATGAQFTVQDVAVGKRIAKSARYWRRHDWGQ